VADYNLFDEIHMHDELSMIIGRTVDILDRSVIESSSNRFIRAELLQSAETVYAR
jgi:predicted nucleotidyltransferase